MKKRIRFLILIVIFTSCSNNDVKRVELMELINSAAVAFAYNGSELDSFLQNPDKAYVSGYFYFESDLADDVIFGLDIEWFEGVDNPINFLGADWMALAGFQRNGILWFPIGSPENLTGTPTNTDRWEIRDIGQELSPNIWYKMTIEANFGAREFISLKLEGNGMNIEIDITGFQLEYPNYIPFDKPALTYYTFALRSQEFSPENQGGSKVYFDDIEIGIKSVSGNTILFNNSFENQTQIQEIPFVLPVSPISSIAENFWYFENDDAKINITNTISRTGLKSIECNADLSKK